MQGRDCNNNVDSRGASLFREFWRVPFDSVDPIDTLTGPNLGDNTVRDKVFEALGNAVRALKKAGFSADDALGTLQYRDTKGGRVMVHGGDEFEGVLNKIGSMLPVAATEKGFTLDYGASYLRTVTFDERGPLAQGLLTYGQSSDPSSPYAFDQLLSFSRKQWIDLPFHPRNIDAQSVGPVLLLRR